MRSFIRTMGFVLFSFPILALADQASRSSHFETDENGFAKAPAEFMGFTISATIHCAETATKANQAIQRLGEQIDKVLTPFIDPTVEDGVQKFAGTSSRADLVKYQNGASITICSGWQSTLSYFMKLTRIEDIPTFQDGVLEINPPGDPKIDVALSAPKPGIFSKTYEDLVDKALRDAHQKAIRRVGVLIADSPGLKEFELIRVGSSKDASGSVAYDQTGLGSDPTISTKNSVNVSIARRFVFDLK